MKPSTSLRLLRAVEQRGLPKNVAEARWYTLEWLSGEAQEGVYTRDNYDNYLWTRTRASGEQEKRRWHLAKQVVQKQARHRADLGGAWFNLASCPMLDWALALVTQAAKDQNRTDILELVDKAREKRKEVKSDRKSKRDQKGMYDAGTVWASRRVQWLHWDDFYTWIVRGEALPDALGEKLNQEVAVYRDEFLELAMSDARPAPADGMTPAGEASFASVSKPPLLPFKHESYNTVWAQASGSKVFSVRVENQNDLTVMVKIGSRGALDVGSRGNITLAPARLLGDEYLEGYLLLNDKALVADLVVHGKYAAYREENEPGPEILAIWHALLKGYRVERYTVDGREERPVPSTQLAEYEDESEEESGAFGADSSDYEELHKRWLRDGDLNDLRVMLDWLEDQGLSPEQKLERQCDLLAERMDRMWGMSQTVRHLPQELKERMEKPLREPQFHPSSEWRAVAAEALMQGYRILFTLDAQVIPRLNMWIQTSGSIPRHAQMNVEFQLAEGVRVDLRLRDIDEDGKHWFVDIKQIWTSNALRLSADYYRGWLLDNRHGHPQDQNILMRLDGEMEPMPELLV